MKVSENIVYVRVAPWRVYEDLTIGKAYKVLGYANANFLIKDDVGSYIHVNPYYFDTLDILRDQKISSILGI